jgi:4-hydroxybenzoate polyprenyltransferase
MLGRIRYLWSRATTPVKAGLLFGALGGLFMGAIMALLGWFREKGDLLGLLLALLISFATLGVVAWAIAQAIQEAEKDERV